MKAIATVCEPTMIIPILLSNQKLNINHIDNQSYTTLIKEIAENKWRFTESRISIVKALLDIPKLT